MLLNKLHQVFHWVQVWILVKHSSEHYKCIPPFFFFFFAMLPLMQRDLGASCYRQQGSNEGESAIHIKWVNSLGRYMLLTWRRPSWFVLIPEDKSVVKVGTKEKRKKKLKILFTLGLGIAQPHGCNGILHGVLQQYSTFHLSWEQEGRVWPSPLFFVWWIPWKITKAILL